MAAALSESTRYLVDKAESFNKSEASRLGRLVFCLIVANVTLTLFLLLGAWAAWHEVQTLLGSHNATTQHASEALVNAKLTERKFDQFRDKQIELNKAVANAIEELSK
jgi:hypothetical protein